MKWTDKDAKIFAALAQRLNDSGFQWIVLRNYENLPVENESKDIDIAIRFSDRRAIEDIIKKNTSK